MSLHAAVRGPLSYASPLPAAHTAHACVLAYFTCSTALFTKSDTSNHGWGSSQAGKGFLSLKDERINIHIPFEQCPHITVLSAFVGSRRLQHILILPRKDLPSEFAQSLTEEYVIGIANSDNGWIERPHKVHAVIAISNRNQ